MNIFWKLLEIKTWKKDMLIKAVHVPNATASGEWSYFVYYYDIFTHTYYINDLDNFCNNERTSAINIIEHIVTKAHTQEMNSFVDLLKKIQMRKKPKVFCIYLQKLTGDVIIDKISLEVIRGADSSITWFKNPRWEKKQTSIDL